MTEYVIRPATLDDVRAIAAVHVQSWQTSYRDILPQHVLTAITVERRVQLWLQNLGDPHRMALIGTTREGRVVGFCDAGPNRDVPERYHGEIYAIYLLDEAKRQGLGRALFLRTSDWFRQNEMTPFLVWVLTANLAARQFYEALGGQAILEKLISIGGAPYAEMAYAWPSE